MQRGASQTNQILSYSNKYTVKLAHQMKFRFTQCITQGYFQLQDESKHLLWHKQSYLPSCWSHYDAKMAAMAPAIVSTFKERKKGKGSGSSAGEYIDRPGKCYMASHLSEKQKTSQKPQYSSYTSLVRITLHGTPSCQGGNKHQYPTQD